MNTLFALLTLQAVMGAIDNLWHHELTERLPGKRSARLELSLHAAREALYAFLFLALAWYTWHGGWAWVIGAVVIAEIVITLGDFIVEDRTRRLPELERVLHTLLAISIGAVLAALWPVLAVWASMPHGVVAVDHGLVSWMFTVFGVGAAVWSLRNGIAALSHLRPPRWVREPLERAAQPTGRSVLVSGATGFVGQYLVRHLLRRGDSVIVWTRDADRALDLFGPHVRIVTELAELAGQPQLHAVVHLAGAPVFGIPWTASRRRTLIASRVESATALLDLCSKLPNPPRVWVGASAIGYYGAHEARRISESDGSGVDFQSELCRSVERMGDAAEALGIRSVMLRIGLVLGSGGILERLALPTRMGLGTVLGDGRQWWSWVHIDDLVRIIAFCIDTPRVSGAVNAVAPQAVRQRDFQRLLARTLNRPQWLRVPAAPLRVALGEMSGLLLEGQRVIPARLSALGFDFRRPTLRSALRNLLIQRQAAPAVVTPTARCEVYYNADCPVCSFEMSHYAKALAETAGNGPEMLFVDGPREADRLVSWGLRAEHLESRLYLRDEHGRVSSGFDAMLALWNRLPVYRSVARVFRLPGLHAAGAALYDHVIAPLLTAWARRRSNAELRRRAHT